jgi:hypothetical protein
MWWREGVKREREREREREKERERGIDLCWGNGSFDYGDWEIQNLQTNARVEFQASVSFQAQRLLASEFTLAKERSVFMSYSGVPLFGLS